MLVEPYVAGTELVLEAPHFCATLCSTGLGWSVCARPFMRLARLGPRTGATSSLFPHLAFLASISSSSFAVPSCSSCVGPVPTRWSGGGLLPPPMNDAREGADPVEGFLAEARAKMFSRAEAVSLTSLAWREVDELEGRWEAGEGAGAATVALIASWVMVREDWRSVRALRALRVRWTSCEERRTLVSACCCGQMSCSPAATRASRRRGGSSTELAIACTDSSRGPSAARSHSQRLPSSSKPSDDVPEVPSQRPLSTVRTGFKSSPLPGCPYSRPPPAALTVPTAPWDLPLAESLRTPHRRERWRRQRIEAGSGC